MADTASPRSIFALFRSPNGKRALAGLASLLLVLEVALGARVLGANLIELYLRRVGQNRLCLYPDTAIYWQLARAIRAGGPYEIVEWGDIPHFALRAPGYPIVLAACHAIFGESTMAVRLAQAFLGTVSVSLLYLLTRLIACAGEPPIPAEANQVATQHQKVPLVAAAVAALNPYYILMSSLILSEAVFTSLLLAALSGLAVLWAKPGREVRTAGWRTALVALATGAACGAAVLVRPSCLLLVPAILTIWIVAKARQRDRSTAALRNAFLCVVGIGVVMGPWIARNARVYGTFVPTSLWLGASLYDGINPGATGASDMAFLADQDIWPLDERGQDGTLRDKAIAFGRANPGRVLELAIAKLGRYWSPWPRSEGISSPLLAVSSAMVELPIFALAAAGGWARRRDVRALVLLAFPVLYFCGLHVVFASSIRYRIPAEMPLVGLAAIGLGAIAARARRGR
jgi:4-amino-4-deoxy-L-arabinose transferase-like glycosyltransferase